MRQQRNRLPCASAYTEERLLLRRGRTVLAGRTRRRGFSLTEFFVAMMLFGLTISGLFPLVTLYSRILGSLEQCPDQVSQPLKTSNAYRVVTSVPSVSSFDAEWYQVPAGAGPNSGEWVRKRFLVPFSDSDTNAAVDSKLSAADAWSRRLGAIASIRYKRPVDRSMPTDLCNSPQNLPEPTKPTNTNPAGVDAGDATYYAESPPPSDPAHPWTPASGTYYNANARQSPSGATSTPTATWTVTVTTAGWYQVQATGLVPGAMPSGCFYKLSSDGGATWGDPIAPDLTFGQSSTWQPLATKYFSAGSVNVQLTTNTLGTAIADGMRLVRCSLQITSWPDFKAATPTATVDIKTAVRP